MFLPLSFNSEASGNMSLSMSLYMQIIMSMSGSCERIFLASSADSAHSNVGGSDMLRPTYSLYTLDSICPSSSMMKAS